jgi:RecA/RadA recombinase
MNTVFKMLMKTNEMASIASDGLISDIKSWIDTDCYIFNAILSGSIYKGFPGNKIVLFGGQPSTGKSFLTLAIIKKFLNQFEKNHVIYFDSEQALETGILKQFDLLSDRFLYVPCGTLENLQSQIVKTLNEIKSIKENSPDMNFFIVVDSISMLASESEIVNALKDDIKADVGRAQKLLHSIFRTIVLLSGITRTPIIATVHTYDTMSLYAKRGFSGGKAGIYAGTIVMELSASSDKDSDKNVTGIIVTAKLRKSRVVKQDSEIKLKINNSTGLDKYFGLLDFVIDYGIFKKDGKKLIIPAIDGKEKEWVFKSEIENNPEKYFTKEILDLIDKKCNSVFKYGQLPMSLSPIGLSSDAQRKS